MDQVEAARRLNKLVRMKYANMSNAYMADVMGLEQSTLSEILADDEFKQAYEQYASTRAEEAEQFDSSWDGIEKQALTSLKTQLAVNNDPNLLLRVAAVANKAQRRNVNRQPLNAENGAPVVINLQQNYITKLENERPADRKPVVEHDVNAGNHKAVDMLDAGKVQKVLGVHDPTDDSYVGVSEHEWDRMLASA